MFKVDSRLPALLISLIALLHFAIPRVSAQTRSASGVGAGAASSKSLVVIGIKADWNNKPTDPVKLFAKMSSMPLEFAVASLDEANGLQRTRVSVARATEKSNRRWISLTLVPGSYYLWGIPTTVLSRDISFPREQAGGFLLRVPPHQPVIYAGTIHFRLQGSSFLMERFIHHWESSVVDERSDAERFVRMQDNDKPAVELMEEYGKPWLATSAPYPALVLSFSRSAVNAPDWKQRKAQIAVGPSRFLGEVAMGSGAAGAAAGLLALAYYPIGLVLGQVFGAADALKWQSCVEGLNSEVELRTPVSSMRERLAEALGTKAVIYETEQPTINDPSALASKSGCKGVFLADILRIQLREYSAGRFGIELVTRVRLWDAVARRFVFDRIVVAGHDNPRPIHGEVERARVNWMLTIPFPPPYEIRVMTPSPTRSLQDYCGDTGRDLFAAELNIAIVQTVEYFAGVLGA